MSDSIYDHGFARVGAITLPVHLGDPHRNAQEIIEAARKCSKQSVAVAVFPESSLTGYSIDDLVFGQPLLSAVRNALDQVIAASEDLFPILVVGAPLELHDRLYNCAVIIHRGKILGVTPKMHLPTYSEFYEERYFSTPSSLTSVENVRWDGRLVAVPEKSGLGGATLRDEGERAFPFGAFQVQVLDVPGLVLAAEICEDLWVPIPPSSVSALQGATVIANLSASPDTVGRTSTRGSLVEAHSRATLTAYIYTASGFGESSTDLSWDGETLICEGGATLVQGEHFRPGVDVSVADVDLDLLIDARRQQNTFADNARMANVPAPRVVQVRIDPPSTDIGFARYVPAAPFRAGFGNAEKEAFDIQVSALVRRMVSIGNPRLILGVSGGLDSTLALLVAARAMDVQGRPRTDILAYTMPGFGTTAVTRTNAQDLAESLGVTFAELDIRPAASAMLQAMGHPFGKGEPVYDVTFENVQAGLRTDYLFRLAGQHGGIVVGTGDLSELALGWCTFGVGDHMSHYGVNAGLPKTMIQQVLAWVSEDEPFGPYLTSTVQSILETEISPELVPVGEDGSGQATESFIGPYELQDSTLYHVLHSGFGPAKILFLQRKAWGHKYSDVELVKWLEVFFRRFFQNQYKRSTLPNGPKVMAGGSLSPRGDWRMPSDALAGAWLREVEELKTAVEGAGEAGARAAGEADPSGVDGADPTAAGEADPSGVDGAGPVTVSEADPTTAKEESR